MGDLQGGGSYRLRERDDEALFGYVVGPQGWKSLLFPSRELLWSGQRDGAEMDVEPAATGAPRVSRCSGSGPATCTLGLAAVVELGRSLDLLPRSLVVIGVEATQFDTGSPMSDAVEAAVPAAADAVFTAIDNSAGWS